MKNELDLIPYTKVTKIFPAKMNLINEKLHPKKTRVIWANNRQELIGYLKDGYQASADINPKLAAQVVQTNVLGTFLATQAFLGHMNTEHARMIYFPGTMGKYIMRNSALYSATKFAIQGMVKGLVEEHKRSNTQFSLLYLGGVDTPFWDDEDVQMKVKKEAMLNPAVIAKVVGNILGLPSTHVVNEMVIQPNSHQLV